MESINKLFFHQWQRKLVALLTAAVIWIFVNYSITSSKTIPSVPIRVINLPANKTIQGLLPNGFLSKRTTLTLTGTKDVIDQLEPGDVEVILDVLNLPSDGIVQITKKNLVSLNPSFNLLKHVTSVTHPEFVIKMSPILMEKIPIVIHPPIGDPPKGYQFLDIWPMHLMQTVSGPEEQVLALKSQGLELTFNLNEITQEELDHLYDQDSHDNEITFYVPDQWKKVVTPFSTRGPELVNDPEAKNLQINFLRQQLIPIKEELSIHVFYPLKYSEAINPGTYPLSASEFIQFKYELPVLTVPLFANNVSKLFLNIVKDNLEIALVAAPQTERERLEWSLNFIDHTHLEDTYVAFLLSNSKTVDSIQNKNREREKHFRQRFRLYMQQLTLYLPSQHKLEIESWLEEGKIKVHIPNAFLPPKSLPNHHPEKDPSYAY